MFQGFSECVFYVRLSEYYATMIFKELPCCQVPTVYVQYVLVFVVSGDVNWLFITQETGLVREVVG